MARRERWAVVAAAIALTVATPAVARAQGEPFRDPQRPLDERIDDLMGRLTQDEKIGLLHQYQGAIPRLGIGTFKAGTEDTRESPALEILHLAMNEGARNLIRTGRLVPSDTM